MARVAGDHEAAEIELTGKNPIVCCRVKKTLEHASGGKDSGSGEYEGQKSCYSPQYVRSFEHHFLKELITYIL